MKRTRVTGGHRLLFLAIGLALLVGRLDSREWGKRTQATPSEPPWRSHLVLWPRGEGEATPWRDDARLRGRFEPGFPDDLMVYFMGREPGEEPEGMWVTVIDYHPQTDLFLGILVNQPFHLKGVDDRDNVVFRYDSEQKQPVAVDDGRGYRATALPGTKEPAFLSPLIEGLRAYRQGDFGHNMPGIDHCIAVLSPLVKNVPPAAAVGERFAAHFVLARCCAEKYATKTSVEQFRAAIAFAPEDVDAQMGLLAELSILVHPPAGQPVPSDQAAWDAAFLDQIALVTVKFKEDKRVRAITSLIFDASRADLSKLSADEIARSKRVGYATFRWKSR